MVGYEEDEREWMLSRRLKRRGTTGGEGEMVEKDIPVDDDIGLGKHCKCGRWRSWADYEMGQLCECGRRLAMVRHCSICRTETTGAPLCDRCAVQVHSNCSMARLAIAAGACVDSGAVRNLRRDEALVAEYDEWKEARCST